MKICFLGAGALGSAADRLADQLGIRYILFHHRIRGQRLDRVFSERVFGPLGMRDTAWHVAPEKRALLEQLLRMMNDIRDARSGSTSPTSKLTGPAVASSARR